MTAPPPGAGPRRVLVLTTGGTIGSRTEGGRKVYPDGHAILSQAGGPTGVEAEVQFEAVAAIGSQDMSLDLWRELHRRIEAAFRTDAADAVVVAHGTDTLEETAFLLDLLIPPGRPVVLVGAMRPADAPDADGPANLADALAVALALASRNRGVLLAMGGAIHGARDVRKAVVGGAYALASSGAGALGEVADGEASYFRPPAPSGLAGRFRLPERGGLPRVHILYCATDMAREEIEFGWPAGLAGLVTAGFGHGNLPHAVIHGLADQARQGVAVVRSSRIAGDCIDGDGEVNDEAAGFIVSRGLSPQKARLLLRLLLAGGHTGRAALQSAFDAC